MAALRARLDEAEQTLEAIRSGHVDALVVSTPDGERIFTLKGADHSYRRLVETMNEGAAMLGRDGCVLYCNQRFADMLGEPLETLIGGTLERFVPRGAQPTLEALIRRGEKGTARAEMELRARGGFVPVHLSATSNGDGDVGGVCVVATDLTDQKRNAAMVAAERLALSILEQVAEAIVVCDPSGRVLRASLAAHRLAGENPLLQPFDAVFPLRLAQPEAGRTPSAALEASLRGEVTSGLETVLERPDGRTVTLVLSAGPLLDARGAILGCIVSLTDISETKRAEEERAQLLARERAARAAAEANAARVARLQHVASALAEALRPADVAAVVVDQGLAALGAKLARLYALGPHRSALEVLDVRGIPEEHLEAIRRIAIDDALVVAAAARTAAPVFVEREAQWETYRSLSAKLREHTGVDAMAAIPLELHGQVVGAVAFGFVGARAFAPDERDFVLALARQSTQALERARLYEAERAARADAETANRMKDEFLATMSHELRTPLNAMLGWSVTLRAKVHDPASVERGLSVIERNARAQSRLIDDVLDVSRIISGKLQLKSEAVELSSVALAAVDVVRPAAEAKDIELLVHPPPPSTPFVYGDPDRLQQIVWNLVSNAVKFTPRAGRVEVELFQDGSNVGVRVTDTGQGIRADVLPYIFERFRQADSSSTRRHGGLGLGLAIVRHLAELHGGTVAATSDGEGYGATFTVTVPVRAVRSSTDLAAVSEASANSAPRLEVVGALSGLRVVVVDDDDDARELVSEVLLQAGAEVRAAGSAIDALAEVEGWLPDVLVSDVGMPETDGYAFVRHVRALAAERGGRTPAVALTAYASADDAKRALAAGFQKHLAKPVDPQTLVKIVGNLGGRTTTDA